MSFSGKKNRQRGRVPRLPFHNQAKNAFRPPKLTLSCSVRSLHTTTILSCCWQREQGTQSSHVAWCLQVGDGDRTEEALFLYIPSESLLSSFSYLPTCKHVEMKGWHLNLHVDKQIEEFIAKLYGMSIRIESKVNHMVTQK